MLSLQYLDQLHNILTEFKLSNLAQETYIRLLLGDSPNLSQLAKVLKISRPHLYKLLSELEIATLISFEKNTGGIGSIQVISPTILLEKIRETKTHVAKVENEMLKILPQLMMQFDQGNQASKIRVVTGAKDFFTLLMSIADEENKSIIYFGSIDHFIECVTWTNQDKWMKARITAGLKIQALLTESAEAYLLKRKDKEQLRETRILKNYDNFVTSYHVFSNKTIFWQPKAKLAILIEDQHIAQMMKMMFQSLWENN